eukprot:756377-Hanusia_phi.AAC.3
MVGLVWLINELSHNFSPPVPGGRTSSLWHRARNGVSWSTTGAFLLPLDGMSGLKLASVIFPPNYEPHGVKMKYKGETVTLTPEQVGSHAVREKFIEAVCRKR